MPLYQPSSSGFIPPALVTGRYVHLMSQGANTTSAALGNGSLRVCPLLLHRSTSYDRLGTDITVAGEAGSTLRIGVYADNGNRYPGNLILDAGTIDGTSATVQEVTVSLSLAPGLYWVGGAVQNVVTTQPTVRVVANFTPPVITSIGTANTNTAASVGHFQSGVTGALPGTFTTTVTLAAVAPRIFARTA